MIVHQISLQADSAALRYDLFTGVLKGMFHQALNSADFGKPGHPARLVSAAYVQADDYVANAREDAGAFITVVAKEAHAATIAQLRSNDSAELSPPALEHLLVTQSYLIDELIAQIHRDVASVRKSMQRMVLDVSSTARSRRIPVRTAMIEHLVANPDVVEFSFLDRASRRWNSTKFVRQLWRHTLLTVYNEVVLLTLADHGLERAQLRYEHAGEEMLGEPLSIGPSLDLSSYAEVRDTRFHPNANAWLAMEVDHVSP